MGKLLTMRIMLIDADNDLRAFRDRDINAQAMVIENPDDEVAVAKAMAAREIVAMRMKEMLDGCYVELVLDAEQGQAERS